MAIGADYPFMDVLWSMILFFCWVAWIWLLILVICDMFRRDISSWAKAVWFVFLITVPFLGALIYLIAEGKEMTERARRATSQASQAKFDDYVRKVAADGGLGRGDPPREGAARQRRDHAAGVRGGEGQGAGLILASPRRA